MNKSYQVTLFCSTGQYRPVSCIITRDSSEIDRIGKLEFVKELKTRGIQKICAQRRWNSTDLKRYNYTNIKIRECGGSV